MALEEDHLRYLGDPEIALPARAHNGVDAPLGLSKSRHGQVGLEAPPFGCEPEGASDRFRSRLKLEKRRGRLRDSHPEDAGVSAIREDPTSAEVEGESRKPLERFRKTRGKGLDDFARHLPEEAERKMKSFRRDPSRAPGEGSKLALELREPSPNLGIEIDGKKDAHQSIRKERKDAKSVRRGIGRWRGYGDKTVRMNPGPHPLIPSYPLIPLVLVFLCAFASLRLCVLLDSSRALSLLREAQELEPHQF